MTSSQPTRWQTTSETRENWGRLQVVVNGTDVTFFRGVAVEVPNWTSTDPFDDATAQINFPQITPFDQPGQGDLAWLKDWSNVDIYYIPDDYPTTDKSKVWEGMITSFDLSGGSDGSTLTVTCIGALYQLDLYVRAPKFISTDLRHEDHIRFQFDKGSRAHLRTAEMGPPQFPGWWTLTDPDTGENVTGHTTKFTGDWGRPLTGFIQDLLATMQYSDGSQWTVLKDEGRIPVLKLRDTTTVNWTVSCIQPGVEINLTRDLSQAVNVMYAQGSDQAGTEWRNANVSSDGSATGYDPLAYDPRVHPVTTTNPSFDDNAVRVENFSNYGGGFSQAEAKVSAERIIHREKEPGWNGSLSLSSDPEEGSRFLMKAGQNILVKEVAGSGQEGFLFHIAEADIDFQGGSVSLRIDTRARDLLTLEEAQMRNRDSKTPSRLIRVGRESQTFDDTKHPWDYTAGSGFIPKAAKDLPFGTTAFPWSSITTQYPPRDYPEYYIHVDADAATANLRWNIHIDNTVEREKARILCASKAIIRTTEIVAVDEDGNILAVPFHVSFYSNEVTHMAMPTDPVTGEHHPFHEYAFRSVPEADPLAGPDQALIVGWGDGDQKAGFWPGLESNANPATGKLKDDGQWSFDKSGVIEVDSEAPIIYCAIYCDTTAETTPSDVYFIGRLFKAVEDS